MPAMDNRHARSDGFSCVGDAKTPIQRHGTMRILMLSSELYPYAKTGGLADAVRALTDALRENGHDVRLMIPEYCLTPDRKKIAEGSIPLGFARVSYKAQQLAIGTSFPLIAIDAPSFFLRKGIYGDAEQSEFSDNAARFALFYRAALDTCNTLGWIPDIIHCHDWHAAPAMAYRKSVFLPERSGAQAGILTIHNFGYRGFFPVHDIHYTGLEKLDVRPKVSSPDTFSFLLCGLHHAERVTTVSPTYAREIVQDGPDEFAGALRQRSDSVVGILNGIDYDLWNPEKDPFLPFPFGRDNLAGKEACKVKLQQELGLPVDTDLPLIGMIGRLASQKGIEELLGPGYGCLEKICQTLSVQFAILGTGERWAEEELIRLGNFNQNVSTTIGFSEELAHKIEAASDFFLMPSRYEPCGLNQLYSLAYATLPIVTRTGGLCDTVEEYDPATGKGTGFFVSGELPHAIFDAVQSAVNVWRFHRSRIEHMRQTAMSRRFTWEQAALAYEKVYLSALR